MVEAKFRISPPERKNLEDKFFAMLFLPKFQEALTACAEKTQETGLETGFEVVSYPQEPFWIEDVKVGGVDGMGMSKVFKEIDGEGEEGYEFREYFHFHFHPGSKDLAIPSPDDLKAFRDKEVQPQYIGIGSVDDGGKITIFVIKKPQYRLIGYDLQYYEEQVDGVSSYGALQELLRTISLTGFVVEIKTTS